MIRLFKKTLGKLFFWYHEWSQMLAQKGQIDSLKAHVNVSIKETARFGSHCTFFVNSPVRSFAIGEDFSCRSFCSFLVFPGASLIIHSKVFFNNYCSINCLGHIEIGEKTIFGEGVKLYDHNHHYEFVEAQLKVEREKFTIGSIKIGKNCWIGSNVTILKNVEIGDNVIVGANCLVHKSIPANSIVKAKVD